MGINVRTWWTGSRVKRFRIPFWGKRFWNYIPQPHWLRRWYYRKSIQWWGHPSSHHWKGHLIPDYFEGGNHGPALLAGERDVWGGGYCDGVNEQGAN